jgi:hypothetical protein
VSRPVFGVDNCRSERLRSSPAVQCQMVLDRVELDVPDLPDCHDVGDPGRPPPVALRATQDARPEHVLFWQKVDRRAGDLPVRRDYRRQIPAPSGAGIWSLRPAAAWVQAQRSGQPLFLRRRLIRSKMICTIAIVSAPRAPHQLHGSLGRRIPFALSNAGR